MCKKISIDSYAFFGNKLYHVMAVHYRMKTAMIVKTKVKNKENFNIQKYFEMQFTYSYMTGIQSGNSKPIVSST